MISAYCERKPAPHAKQAGTQSPDRPVAWWAHFNLKWPFDVTNPRHSDEDIRKELQQIWPDVEALVAKVEVGILKHADELTAVQLTTAIRTLTGSGSFSGTVQDSATRARDLRFVDR